MTENTLPCPFCGAWNIGYYDVDGQDIHSFQCLECFASSRTQRSRADALAAWNRRAPLSAALPELRGFLAAAADGSMSRTNQENLAAELLEQLEKLESQQ